MIGMMNTQSSDNGGYTTIVHEAAEISRYGRSIESLSRNFNASFLGNSQSVKRLLADLDQLLKRLRKLKHLLDVGFRANPQHPLELMLRHGINQLEATTKEVRKDLRKSAVGKAAGNDTSRTNYVLRNSMYSLAIELANLRSQLDRIENATFI